MGIQVPVIQAPVIQVQPNIGENFLIEYNENDSNEIMFNHIIEKEKIENEIMFTKKPNQSIEQNLLLETKVNSVKEIEHIIEPNQSKIVEKEKEGEQIPIY